MRSEPWKPVIRHLADSLTQDPSTQVVKAILQDLSQLEDFFKIHSSDQDGENIRSYTLDTISLPEFFTLLASNHHPLVTKVAKVIHFLILPVSYQALDRDHADYLVEGLQHPNPTVQRLVLAQLAKYMPAEGPFAGKYVPWILLLLKSPEASVVKDAQELLVSLGRSMANLPTLLCPENAEILIAMLEDASVRFRIYDLFVTIAQTSDQALQYCADHAVFNSLFQEATSSDLLCRLSALDVYRMLCQTTQGFNLVVSSGALTPYAKAVESLDMDIDTRLIACSTIKFFANLCAEVDIDLANFTPLNKVLNCLPRLMAESDGDVQEVVIAAVGTIGSTESGLLLLDQQGPLLTRLVEKYNEADTKHSTALLRALAQTWTTSVPVPTNRRAIAQSMFDHIQPSRQLPQLVRYAKLDSDEVSTASLQLLRQMAKYSWGRQAMRASSEFMGFILDRRTNQAHENKQYKYAIVEALVDAEQSEPVFDEPVQQLFVGYLREGPFYVPREAAVAFEAQ
ncbi:hypothetical protein H4R35_006338 [Dimargaris xerosporica]|nr:hypothetical protein H4R35_006338 [Dimargaris xerosporica]